MPAKSGDRPFELVLDREPIVDLSARSTIIEAEPFGLHLWECTRKNFWII
jgi:hypothetical protein